MKGIKYLFAIFTLLCCCALVQAKDLGIGVKQFTQRVNANLTSINSPYQLGSNLKVEKGEVNDIVNFQFSDNFFVMMTLNKKNQNLISVMTMVVPNTGDAQGNLEMFFANAAVITAFEGKGGMKKLGEKFLKMTSQTMSKWADTHKDASNKFIVNGKKYGLTVSSYTGVMSFAEFAN